MSRSSTKRTLSVNLSPERMDLLSNLLVGDLTEIVSEGIRGWLNERGVLLAGRAFDECGSAGSGRSAIPARRES